MTSVFVRIANVSLLIEVTSQPMTAEEWERIKKWKRHKASIEQLTQRGFNQRPQGEMANLLVVCQTTVSDLEHVGIFDKRTHPPNKTATPQSFLTVPASWCCKFQTLFSSLHKPDPVDYLPAYL